MHSTHLPTVPATRCHYWRIVKWTSLNMSLALATRCHYNGVLKWRNLNMSLVLATRCYYRGEGPQWNMFEHVSYGSPQMSVAGGGPGAWAMFGPCTEGVRPGLGVPLRRRHPYMVRSNASCVMVIWAPHGQNDWQTWLKTLHSRNFIGRW